MTPFPAPYTHLYYAADARLGRHVRHDPRSVAYAVGVRPRSAISTVHWTRRIPILDQGSLGSCTGNALTSVLGTDSAGRTATLSVKVRADKYGIFKAGTVALGEAFALSAYMLNTRLDTFTGTYQPTDTGSDGLAAAATGQLLGLFTGYQHAFSMDAVISALQSGPVMWGTVWLNSMYDTDSRGYLVVDRKSGEAGGHELCLSGYNTSTGDFNVDNSWGAAGFGIGGSGLVKSTDLAWLLSQDGDVTAPVYAALPAPPAPPVPVPATVSDADLWAYSKAWAAGKGLS